MRRDNKTVRAGLTLMELLVVLVILSILTLVAVQATDVVVEQTRYETTVRTMQNVQDAIVGPANQRDADGSILISGYVADTGQLPTTLADLLQQPAGISAFSLVTVNSTYGGGTKVQVPYGWNGPYLRLAVGVTQPVDGWGTPLLLDGLNQALVSPGADKLPDTGGGSTTGYSKDIVTSLAPYLGNVSFVLLDETGQPYPGATDKVTVYQVVPDTATPDKKLYESVGGADPSVSVAVGPRIFFAVSSTGKKSPLTRTAVRPTKQVINLTIK